MTAKIHINLSAGILEVEGEPEFVRGIYDDFKTDLNRISFEQNRRHNEAPKLISVNDSNATQDESADSEIASPSSKKKKGKAKAATKRESYTAQDIKTGLPDEENSIFAYLERYKPTSNIEKNTVFVKYLQDIHPHTKITLNHIYTCYSNSGQKPAGALYASVTDTGKASKGYGFIDTSNVDNIRLVQKGEVLLHNLEQKAKNPKS